MAQHEKRPPAITMQPTGLFKRCPRCSRMGEVFLPSWPEPRCPVIVWDGPARGAHGARRDTDLLQSPAGLMAEDFGCGYCPAAPRAFRLAEAGEVWVRPGYAARHVVYILRSAGMVMFHEEGCTPLRSDSAEHEWRPWQEEASCDGLVGDCATCKDWHQAAANRMRSA